MLLTKRANSYFDAANLSRPRRLRRPRVQSLRKGLLAWSLLCCRGWWAEALLIQRNFFSINTGDKKKKKFMCKRNKRRGGKQKLAGKKNDTCQVLQIGRIFAVFIFFLPILTCPGETRNGAFRLPPWITSTRTTKGLEKHQDGGGGDLGWISKTLPRSKHLA